MQYPMMLSKKDSWETPKELFNLLDREFHFTLDPCATPQNAKVKNNYYTKKDNGLIQDWGGQSVFMNPPYGKGGRLIKAWVKKAFDEAHKPHTIVVCLLPCRSDTPWFSSWVLKAKEIRFIKGRLRFSSSKNSAPFPTCIVVFDGSDGSPKLSSLDLRHSTVSSKLDNY